jgi:probable phosphoglycerate mutase
MSDLQCPATVIVAVPAETELGDDGPGSAGSLTSHGREQARALGESLRDRRVAAVWSSDLTPAKQIAEIAAAVLGIGVRVRPGLRDGGDGRPGESSNEVVARVRRELETLADQMRGETALVVGHRGAVDLTLAELVGRRPGESLEPSDGCACCELAVDAGGWVLRSESS